MGFLCSDLRSRVTSFVKGVRFISINRERCPCVLLPGKESLLHAVSGNNGNAYSSFDGLKKLMKKQVQGMDGELSVAAVVVLTLFLYFCR